MIYVLVWCALALQLLLFVSVLLYRVYLLCRTQLPSGRGRLLEARSLIPAHFNLNADDLSYICRNSVLDLPVYLMLLDCFWDVSDLGQFFVNILRHAKDRDNEKLIDVPMVDIKVQK